MNKRPLHLRRSWLFVGATDEKAIRSSFNCKADVCILEFEDFCSPENRPLGRKMLPDILRKWKTLGKVTAVRVNTLEIEDGKKDLEVAISKNLDVLLLPKVNSKKQVDRLLRQKRKIEVKKKISKNKIEFIPNIETALGIININEILNTKFITGALVASEDMGTSLGIKDLKNNEMLNHIRKKFHLACSAFGKTAIDMPYTFNSLEGLIKETKYIKKLGMTAKSTVNYSHCDIINQILTPSISEFKKAEAVIKYFKKAFQNGKRQIYLKGHYLEIPSYISARKISERYKEFLLYDEPNVII